MRSIIIIFSLLLTITATAQHSSYVEIYISDIKTFNHKLYVGIYDNDKDFVAHTNAVDSVIITPTKSTVSIMFKNLKPGDYAIAFFQDLNDNAKLDTKLFGIPAEPIGISNYDHKATTPPTYKKAKFEIKKDIKIEIPLVTPKKDIKGKNKDVNPN